MAIRVVSSSLLDGSARAVLIDCKVCPYCLLTCISLDVSCSSWLVCAVANKSAARPRHELSGVSWKTLGRKSSQSYVRFPLRMLTNWSRISVMERLWRGADSWRSKVAGGSIINPESMLESTDVNDCIDPTGETSRTAWKSAAMSPVVLGERTGGDGDC